VQRGRVGRAIARRELSGEQPFVGLVADAGQRQPVGRVQGSADAEVAWVVDDRLGHERASVLEVPLDLREPSEIGADQRAALFAPIQLKS
jgi:hypothetical protein